MHRNNKDIKDLEGRRKKCHTERKRCFDKKVEKFESCDAQRRVF
jgi:hypothetical protein